MTRPRHPPSLSFAAPKKMTSAPSLALSAGLRPLSEVARGPEFAAFVFASFGRPVALSSDAPDSFTLLAAFGRCRFSLSEESVAQTLGSILGCASTPLRVGLVEDQIFFFSVSCKKVGLEIYKLKGFKRLEFELFFQLFSDSGLSFAHKHCNPVVEFSWQTVRRNPSFVEVVGGAPLSGANCIPLGSSPLQGQQVISRSQHSWPEVL